MKTSININLFGTVYAIDEDAHMLLDQYLTSMKQYFGKQKGGDEIADDIEHRVAEHFWALKQEGNESISIEQVTEIMHKIGNPEEMSTPDEDETTDQGKPEPEAKKNDAHQQADAEPKEKKERRFYRDGRDKMLGGVLSGVCQYFGWNDPVVVRLVFVLLCFLTEGITVWIYLLFWLIAPMAQTAEQRLKMQGKAVNPDTLKSEVLNDATSHSQQPRHDNGSGCLKALLAVVLAPFGCFGAIMVLTLVLALMGMLIGLFSGATGLLTSIFGSTGAVLASCQAPILMLLLCILAAIALPIYLLYRWFRRDTHALSSTTLIIVAGLWLLSIIGCANYGKTLKEQLHDVSWSSLFAGTDYDIDYDNFFDSVISEKIQYDAPNEFNAVKVRGVGQVIYRQGDKYSVERCARSARMFERTSVVIRDGVLYIENNDVDGVSEANNMQVIITSPTITSVGMEGVGALQLADTVRCDNPVTLSLQGVGTLTADYLEAPVVIARNEGVGTSNLNVNCDSLKVSIEGIGTMKLRGQAHHYSRNQKDLLGTIKDSGLDILE